MDYYQEPITIKAKIKPTGGREKFSVSFGYDFMGHQEQDFTWCVLATRDPLKFYSGVAVQHPGEPHNNKYAMRLAFRRAAEAYVFANQLESPFTRKFVLRQLRIALREALGEPIGKPGEK